MNSMPAHVVLGVLLALVHPDPGNAITCRVLNDPRARIFVLDRPPQATDWRISMQDRESAGKWIRLTLRGASPVIGERTASLTYANANGGRRVVLDAGPTHSRLEIDVDYGLEVNIEPDLDPAVDRMNTGGPLTTLQCGIGTPGM
jgi:hypothetical protein